jgi:copper oxidase (laccase) domain-containing protein
MIDQPFSLFEPYADHIRIALFTKEDAVASDAEAAKQLCLKKAAGLHQVHGNKTVVVDEELNRTDQADGMLTKTSELVLATRWADCQNFVMYAPEKHVAGLLHVGWRGLIAGAIPAFFEVLRNNFSIEPADTYVGAGPSLCQQCAGFSNPSSELPDIDPCFFDENHVDLRGAADHSFFSLGVLPEHFQRHPDCTRCHPEHYWTYRGGHKEQVLKGSTNMLCCALL